MSSLVFVAANETANASLRKNTNSLSTWSYIDMRRRSLDNVITWGPDLYFTNFETLQRSTVESLDRPCSCEYGDGP